MAALIANLSGRKFGVMVALLITASVFSLPQIGVLDGGQWLTFATLVFTVYIMGNVAQKGIIGKVNKG